MLVVPDQGLFVRAPLANRKARPEEVGQIGGPRSHLAALPVQYRRTASAEQQVVGPEVVVRQRDSHPAVREIGADPRHEPLRHG
jgi:hypothetical protein